MSETFEYDVFISHSSKDKAAARDLAERLKSDSLHVWFDEWEIRPGDMIRLKDIICVNCEKRVPLWDLIEQKFASEEFQRRVREMEEQARASIDSESRELILVGHAFAIAGEAGQLFQPMPSPEWGIDGKIEFKNNRGEPSGRRVYLQLKIGDYYFQERRADGKEVLTIKDSRKADYWRSQDYPVMLVVRTSDGVIRWMNVTDYLKRQGAKARQVVFDGEPFTALSVARLRDRLFPELMGLT
jgi:hypothetical protein